MSFDTGWDVNKYRGDHESEEHWALRKEFMLQWKNNYPEDRLVCLAQIFVNMELLGCRYPVQVMQEISNLAKEVNSLQKYHNIKKTKLQRTFISAADAVADRIRGIKRVNGESCGPPIKYSKVTFIPQGFVKSTEEVESSDVAICSKGQFEDIPSSVENVSTVCEIKESISLADSSDANASHQSKDVTKYLMDLENVACTDVRRFRESMFNTEYGRFVMLIRGEPLAWCITNSCSVCKLPLKSFYNNEIERFTLEMNGKIVGEGFGIKAIAKKTATDMAWKLLREQVITVVVKESWIADGGRISTKDVTRASSDQQFGTPVDNAVATKMMKLMGWSGGGLGADSQGISEPIKPHIRMVNRAGLGNGVERSGSGGNRGVRAAGTELMRRFAASDSLDVDLVFSSDFSKEERTVLHSCAQRQGLASKSYGTGDDRFLVVKKKTDPFSIVRAVVQKGGDTPKYKLFIPISLDRG